MSGPAPLELRAERLRRNGIALVIAASPLLGAATLVAGAWWEHTSAPLIYSPFCIFLGVFFTFHVWKDNPKPHRMAGTIRIDERLVTWDGAPLARRDEIERVTHHREDGATVVRLHRKKATDLQILVRDDAWARAIIDALGFGADRSTAKFVGKSRIFSLASWQRTAMHVAMLGGSGIAAAQMESVFHSWPAFFATLLVGVLITFGLSAATTTIEVGADALSMRWLGLRRIVPLAEVVEVEETIQIERFQRSRGVSTTVIHHAATIATRGRKPWTVRFGTSSYDIAQRNHFIERVREVQAARARGADAIDTGFLARGGRDLAAWMAALRSGAAPEGGMRSAPIPTERFWRIVEDASAGAVDRAAAAVAIGRQAAPEQRERVRIAARQTIEPALRKALECAVDEQAEEEVVAAALEAVEAGQAAQRRDRERG